MLAVNSKHLMGKICVYWPTLELFFYSLILVLTIGRLQYGGEKKANEQNTLFRQKAVQNTAQNGMKCTAVKLPDTMEQ